MLLVLGAALVAVSAFYASAFLVAAGACAVFWGIVLLYITPARHVLLTLLNAVSKSNVSNIERLLTELKLTEKAIYLPPKSLKQIESSLIYIPEIADAKLPTPEETTTEKLYGEHQKGVFLTPPGLGLSELFEEALGTSFTKIDLERLRKNLSSLLVTDLEIVTSAEINVENNVIMVELTGNVFEYLCEQTDLFPQTHRQVGCILASSFACSFAKATGKPITIQGETHDLSTKTLIIKYLIGEG